MYYEFILMEREDEHAPFVVIEHTICPQYRRTQVSKLFLLKLMKDPHNRELKINELDEHGHIQRVLQ